MSGGVLLTPRGCPAGGRQTRAAVLGGGGSGGAREVSGGGARAAGRGGAGGGAGAAAPPAERRAGTAPARRSPDGSFSAVAVAVTVASGRLGQLRRRLGL